MIYKIMNYVKTFEQFLFESSNNEQVRLCDVMDEYPDNEEELLCQWVTYDEFNEEYFPVVEINPVEWYNNHTVDGAGTTIKEAFEQYAEKYQKKLVNVYRRKAEQVADGYLIIHENTLIDGFHRLVALALEGITKVKAVSI